ncbi:hypothetical protein P8452_20303 [Trifolium repens]|nr:hypothetical protein P8452_20303 [Trifolium repens]
MSCESNGGKKKKNKTQRHKKKKVGVTVEENYQEEDIQNNSSTATGDSLDGGGNNQPLIPVSNIQIVLNEGEVNLPNEVHTREIRIEAERLFHIGLNLGITSNEERLRTLDRMVEQTPTFCGAQERGYEDQIQINIVRSSSDLEKYTIQVVEKNR